MSVDTRKLGVLIYRNDEGDTNVDVMLYDVSLTGVQKLVGGYIEQVPLPDFPEGIGLVDEEGLIKHLPVNPVATAMARRTIVGPMLVLGLNRSGSEWVGCPDTIYSVLASYGYGIGSGADRVG